MRFFGRVTPVLVAGVVTALTLTGCSSSKPRTAPPPAPSTSSTVPTTSAPPSSTPTPTPTPSPPPAVNPFTGIGPIPDHVLAVKIDDTANARPMRNIDKADLVYVEQVEGGLTRLMAIYGTSKPLVSSVRSIRFNDPEILAQYGRVTLVASGAAPEVLSFVDGSDLNTDINDRGGPGFQRLGCCAPYNLAADLGVITQAVPGAGAKDVGLRWGPLPPAAAAAPPVSAIRTVVGGTNVGFDWNPGSNRWVREIGGVRQATAAGDPVSTPNVIVQFCQESVDNRDVDVAGNPSAYTHTVGSGPVAVFRDGRRIDGTWTRPTPAAGTTYTDAAGAPIALAPGGAWIVLVAAGGPLTTG